MFIRIRILAAICGLMLTGCLSLPLEPAPRNVIFFLGAGMGLNTMTAARIYAVGEEGALTLDTLPEVAFVKTFSNDAQVSDSAAAMSAYMTGIKVNNKVMSMSADTRAVEPAVAVYGNQTGNQCGPDNGRPVATLAEIARQHGWSAGLVTTTRVTDATPAATYAHVCHRDLENDIAAMLVPGGAGSSAALNGGLDVVLGGGSDFFLPPAKGGKRVDGRDLITEMRAQAYVTIDHAAGLRALDASKTPRLLGLFANSHLNYDLERNAQQPSLADMTLKAIDVLAQNRRGYFLMVDSGRIDHALHESSAAKALQEVVAFDDALRAAIAKVRESDPELRNTLIVATADYDHTLILNGYAKRTGKTTPTNPGVLGLVKSYSNGKLARDLDGAPYSIIGFGTGEHRTQGSRASIAGLDDATVSAAGYRQEAVVRSNVGEDAHGGTDVFLGAIGRGAENFHGTIDNTRVFNLVRTAVGF